MLCALLLPTNTTATELFKSLKLHIRKTELVILCWSVHTVVAMTGWLSCFTTWVKEIAFKCELIYTVTIEKCWLAEKCHLNLTVFAGCD